MTSSKQQATNSKKTLFDYRSQFKVKNSRSSKGFSLLELIIVMVILIILAMIGVGYYVNFARNIELETTRDNIVSDLQKARTKAMAGEGGLKWGIHFVNGVDDYYELFSTPTNYTDASTTVVETAYLRSGLVFTSPPEASSTDVVFDRISGTTAVASIVISGSGNSRTISITTVGNVY